MENAILGMSLVFSTVLTSISGLPAQLNGSEQNEVVLAERSLDLTTRYNNSFVNEVFTDNILLALHYFKGDQNDFKKDPKKDIAYNVDFEKVKKPFEFSLTLNPGEGFAFQPNLSPEFKDKPIKFLGSRYISDEGYKSDGFLIGDGVCHLASLMYWVAEEVSIDGKDLETVARVRHDFAPVNGVPREYGTSIFYSPSGGNNTTNQNLYIKNNFSFPIKLAFSADKEKVEFKIIKEIN